MKIKINNLGYLEFMRGSKWKPQECPFIEASCGDWCPLFAEPDGEEAYRNGQRRLDLCHKAYICDIIDERE